MPFPNGAKGTVCEDQREKAREHPELFADVVVPATVDLVVIAALSSERTEVEIVGERLPLLIRQGHEREAKELCGNRVNSAGGNDVSGERGALNYLAGCARTIAAGAALSQRIVDRDHGVLSVSVSGEVSSIHLRKRYRCCVIGSLTGSKTFPGGKEKHFVLQYGPTASETVL